MPEPKIEQPEADAPVDLTGCENVRPLVEWAEGAEEDEDLCVPCNLSVIAPWYRDVLREAGYADLADEVHALADAEPDALGAARLLDEVKARVDNPIVRDRLTMFDCMAQSEKYEGGGE